MLKCILVTVVEIPNIFDPTCKFNDCAVTGITTYQIFTLILDGHNKW